MYRLAGNALRIAPITISILAGLSLLRPALANLVGVDQSTGILYSISETNAAISMIGNTGIAGTTTGNWADIQLAPNGTLYGFTTTVTAPPNPPSPSLYTINPTTAAVSKIGTLTTTAVVFEGGLTFAPNGTAYAMNLGTAAANSLFTINLATGAETSLGVVKNSTGTANATLDINGLAYRTSDNMLIGLDDLSNSLVVINPSTLREATLAAVPTTVGGIGGMTIDNGVGYYVTAGPGGTSPGSDDLYSFNLLTGASTLIGNLGLTDLGLSGLASVPATIPEPPSWGVLLAALAMFGLATLRRRRRPARWQLICLMTMTFSIAAS